MTILIALSIPFLIALGLSLLLGNPLINILAARKAKQPISTDAPTTHQLKSGTPTMGGLLIVGATTVSSLVGLVLNTQMNSTDRLRFAALLGLFVMGCAIGLLDDLGKARRKQNKAGLSERVKLALQIIVAGLFLMVVAATEQHGVTTYITLGSRDFNLGTTYYALALLFICGFGNAVNFTDGLDGLASGTTLIAATALAISPLLLAPYIGIFYGALAGACAGFLWFNAHPAKVFMGDTGSLALGMGIAGAAILAKQELLLFVIGGVYVLEIVSMMLQRYVFKYRRVRHGIEYAKAHRVFRRAPLHHHFEEAGWAETQVVARFYILGLGFAAIGMLLSRFFLSQQ